MRKKSHSARGQLQDLQQVNNSIICPGCTLADWEKVSRQVIQYYWEMERNWGTGPVINIMYSKYAAEVFMTFKDSSVLYTTDPLTAEPVKGGKTKRYYDPHLALASARIRTETAKLEVERNVYVV